MLNYLAVSGIAFSILYVLSEIGITVFGHLIQMKRETGVPIKIQFIHALNRNEDKSL